MPTSIGPWDSQCHFGVTWRPKLTYNSWCSMICWLKSFTLSQSHSVLKAVSTYATFFTQQTQCGSLLSKNGARTFVEALTKLIVCFEVHLSEPLGVNADVGCFEGGSRSHLNFLTALLNAVLVSEWLKPCLLPVQPRTCTNSSCNWYMAVEA